MREAGGRKRNSEWSWNDWSAGKEMNRKAGSCLMIVWHRKGLGQHHRFNLKKTIFNGWSSNNKTGCYKDWVMNRWKTKVDVLLGWWVEGFQVSRLISNEGAGRERESTALHSQHSTHRESDRGGAGDRGERGIAGIQGINYNTIAICVSFSNGNKLSSGRE